MFVSFSETFHCEKNDKTYRNLLKGKYFFPALYEQQKFRKGKRYSVLLMAFKEAGSKRLLTTKELIKNTVCS